MARKKDNSILLIAGAAGIAYLILKKSAQPAPAPAPGIAAPDLLSQASAIVRNLFATKQLPPSYNSDITAGEPLRPPQVLPDPGLPANLQYTAIDQESIAGFNEIPGTALAVICGCLACAPPLPVIGKMNGKFDWSSLLVPGVVLAGGYLLAKNLGLFGGSAAQNNADIASKTSAANTKSLAAVLAAGSVKTLTDAQYNSLATDIFNQGLSFTGSISSRAQDQMVKDWTTPKTIADIYALKIAFGTKDVSSSFWSTCNWLNFNCATMDLDSFTKANLDSDHIKAINDYFSAMQISYTL